MASMKEIFDKLTDRIVYELEDENSSPAWGTVANAFLKQYFDPDAGKADQRLSAIQDRLAERRDRQRDERFKDNAPKLTIAK